MPHLLIVADDLTGAADTAAPFATRDLVTLVALGDGPAPRADVLALSTDSRHLSADQATSAVRRALRRLSGADARDAALIYKKVDSTLRGNPATELAALMEEVGIDRALIAPALPAQGRTTRAGRQCVDGVPLEDTPFRNEVASSDLTVVFAGLAPQRLPLRTVRAAPATLGAALARAAVVVADAETDADLDSLAAAAHVQGFRLLSGSAGLAAAVARGWPLRARTAPPAVPVAPPGPVLVVAGSRHPRAIEQIRACEAAGVPVIVPRLAGPLPGLAPEGGSMRETRAALTASGAVVVTTSRQAVVLGAPRVVASQLGNWVARLVGSTPIAGLVLTGGDVAGAVLAAVEADAIWLRGEVEPGIPWGTLVGGRLAGLPVVTKAGGFGAPGSLLATIATLRRGQG